MSEFEYCGIGPQDTAIEGRLVAASHDHANQLLEEMQVRVSRLRALDREPKSTVKPISHADFTMLNEQIIAMVKAGVPLEEGFRVLADDVAKPGLKRLVTEIAEDLASGISLEEAIRKRQKAFPVLYAQIIAVGMKTGRLAVVLAGLNRHLEYLGATRRLIWETLNYPLVIAVLGLCIMWFTTQVIGPQMKAIFQDFGTNLPVPTILVLKLSDNLAWIFPTMLAVILGTVILIRGARGPTARRIKEGILLRVPVLRTMVKNCLVARFSQGLSLMVRIGIPLEESVVMAGEATGSPIIISDGRRMREALAKGESVHLALQMGRVLPRFLGHTIEMAIQRNQLDDCLEELSRLYDQRAQQSLSSLRTVLLPIAVLMTAGCMGFYVIALFLPLVKLISSVSGS